MGWPNNRITFVYQLSMTCFTRGSQLYSCNTLLILLDKSFCTWPSEPLLEEIHFQFEELVPLEHPPGPSAIPESTCAPAVQAPVYEDATFDNRFLLDEPQTWEALLLSSQPQALQISPWGIWFPIWCTFVISQKCQNTRYLEDFQILLIKISESWFPGPALLLTLRADWHTDWFPATWRLRKV